MDLPVSRSTLKIALGVLLLLNPLYIDAFGVAHPNSYRYEATEVTYNQSDGIDYDIHARGIDSDIACLGNPLPSRSCTLEYAIYQRGNLTANVSWAGHVENYGPNSYQYAYVDGSFYEVESEEVAYDTGTVRLTLNRAPARRAMRYASTPISRVSHPVRRAIETGSAKTHYAVDGANELVRKNGDYYVVYRVEAHITDNEAYERGEERDSSRETGLTLLGIGVGLGFVLSGQRERVEAEK
ncbi:hypothetical protein [Halorussus halophilus]|uniref:hypothetical protein n=1 Tax=Halorussus halophilus TaxID=2650975 RepID=UPI001301724B|nr:hypothetical protein [Halorussus halophilus]